MQNLWKNEFLEETFDFLKNFKTLIFAEINHFHFNFVRKWELDHILSANIILLIYLETSLARNREILIGGKNYEKFWGNPKFGVGGRDFFRVGRQLWQNVTLDIRHNFCKTPVSEWHFDKCNVISGSSTSFFLVFFA